MPAEAMPNPESEPPKSSKKRKRGSSKKEEKKGEESGVFRKASIDEQMEDVVSVARESSDGARHSRPDIHVSQRARLSEVEREQEERGDADVVSLREKREAWQAELDVLEKRKILSDDERERIVFLRSHIKSVTLIEQRAAEVAKQRAAEEQADEVERDLKAERKRLEEMESERKRMEEERAKVDAEIKKDKDRLDALKRELDARPDDPEAEEKQAEAEAVSQRVAERQAESKDKMFLIHDARVKEKAAHVSVKGKVDALEALLATVALSTTEIAELDEKIEHPESEEEPEPEEPSASAEEVEEPKKKRKEEEVSIRRGGGLLRTTGVLVGAPIAAGAAVFAAGGRFFKTFFRNIYRLSMDPGKFFNELHSKYSSAMKEPPAGKGGLRGFLSGTKWLLIGDPPPKKEKSK